MKPTLLLGIEAGNYWLLENQSGGIRRPGCWVQAIRGTGTTKEVFTHFIGIIVIDVQEQSIVLADNDLPFDKEVFMLWDNLNSPLSPLVQMTLYAHRDKM